MRLTKKRIFSKNGKEDSVKETQEGCLSRSINDFFERPLFKKVALSVAKSLFRHAENAGFCPESMVVRLEFGVEKRGRLWYDMGTDRIVREGLIKSARAICERFFRRSEAGFRRNNCIYFKKSQRSCGEKIPQSAADAFNQCFLKRNGAEEKCMDKSWKNYAPAVCAALGGLCLLAAVLAARGLDRGGWLAVAAALMLLAALALFLLRFEGYGRETLLVMLLPVGVAMLARAVCLDHASGDYNSFLCHWAEYFRENGGFDAVAHAVGDYNVPYLYFMAFISYIPVPDLYLIKLFSVLADVALAWGCLRLTRSLRGGRRRGIAPLAAFAAALLLPTVVLNGAYWGQCDAIYGAFVVHAVAMALEGKNRTSVALMGLAFAFKLQAIFVLPLWGVLWLAKRVRFRELWVFPLTYLAVILPAVLLGKPLSETLLVYFNQMGEYPRLVLNAPSIFQLCPYELSSVSISGDPLLTALSKAGVAAAAALVLAMLWLGFRLRDRLDRQTVFAIAVVLAIGVPFLLPHMHERYFFLGDVLTLCAACANVRRVPAAVLVQASSVASYLVYLRLKFNWWFDFAGHRYVMIPEMLLMLAGLGFAAAALASCLRNRRGRGREA